MQLLSLRVNNFGLYAGEHDFVLAPRVRGGEHRPLTVFVGHNGAGKSTLFTALSVALHGPLALGERVGQAQYNDFLYSRMHRHKGDTKNAVSAEASVALSLEYVQSGVPQRFHVERRWRRSGRIVDETLTVTRDGQLLGIAEADAQAWINDLVPSGIARLCFFDAEDLDALASPDQRNPHLSEALQRLLGLDLIQRLQSDLRAYTVRQGGSAAAAEQRKEVLEHQALLEALDENLKGLKALDGRHRDQEAALMARVADQDRRIAAAGGLYAARQGSQRERREAIQKEIAATQAEVSDFAAHLLPFSLAPRLCQRLAGRLAQEADAQRQQVAETLVSERLGEIDAAVSDEGFFESLKLPRKKQDGVRTLLQDLLRQRMAPSGDHPPFVHQLAAPEQEQLLGWIGQVGDSVPRQAKQVGDRLRKLQRERREIELDLQRAPEEEELAPLHEELTGLRAELAALQRDLSTLAHEIGVAQYKRDEEDRRMQRAIEKLTAAQASEQELVLAERSRSALRAYEDALTRLRLAELEQTLVDCFNTLCQKEHLLASVTIDPDDFTVSLVSEDGRELSLGSFSAGERQLYALSLLQALRKVSGRALPLLVDTPLARLDEEHRERFLHDYLPVASDQILLFATDAEADARFLAQAGPYLAQAYRLRFDPATGSTQETEIKQVDDLLDAAEAEQENIHAL